MPTVEEQKAFHSTIWYHGTGYANPRIVKQKGLIAQTVSPISGTRYHKSSPRLYISTDKEHATAYALLHPNQKNKDRGWVYQLNRPKNIINENSPHNLDTYTTDTMFPTHVTPVYGKSKGNAVHLVKRGQKRKLRYR